ncbi:MAG: hypothetical protein COA88_07205 [Kordia sp.]|nr:MAG: hypothetical protein COA88_07205 [Kordia sp.]
MSCSNNETFESEQELWGFIKDPANEYTQNKSINNVDFQLLYKPTDLLVQQELGDKVSDSLIGKLRNKYNKQLYFSLSMSSNNKELLSSLPKNRAEFGIMVNDLAFGMKEKVYLINQQKDTIMMLDYVYPRMYGMSKSTNILFVFNKNEDKIKSEYLNFTLSNMNIETGDVKFKIPTKIIENQPKLSFKN